MRLPTTFSKRYLAALALAPVVVATGIAAFGNESRSNQPSAGGDNPTRLAQFSEDAGRDGTRSPDAGTEPGDAGTNATPQEEAAGVAFVLNWSEVMSAQYALSVVESDEVREFAERMVTDHTAGSDSAAELFNQLGITPSATGNQTAQDVFRTSIQQLQTLETQARAGNADQAYMTSAVEQHCTKLDLYQNSLIPAAEDDQLRAAFTATLQGILQHTQAAEQILAQLGGPTDTGNGQAGNGQAGNGQAGNGQAGQEAGAPKPPDGSADGGQPGQAGAFEGGAPDGEFGCSTLYTDEGAGGASGEGGAGGADGTAGDENGAAGAAGNGTAGAAGNGAAGNGTAGAAGNGAAGNGTAGAAGAGY